MPNTGPCPANCQIANLNEHRLQRLEQSIALTRTKLDVVGIRLEWLSRKLLSAELEKAELRQTLAERIWEFNLLRHQLRREQQGAEHDSSTAEVRRALTLAD
ncbi:hypothetical protein G3480_04965 [Thiorhodococcus mannitoliphagus]|uniref:Uncharacterized protein n=1 Tax=Thiorhodococcus mannitoliphagus TaxID=329406 RepID=A0A6P1DQ36_9GAMM|nr:hypothetical protein [Thiorhodococcus mannitoliphagus]NEX19670.1 hypothetical protein [Thiorhodococcus mannitoliphagus]